jgi:hypothetical protein
MAKVDQDGQIFVGMSKKAEYLTLRLANRHGLGSGRAIIRVTLGDMLRR